MRGYGYQCDHCGTREIVEGDPFLGGDPLPRRWVATVTGGPS